MAFGPSKAKLSQLERCLSANQPAVFVLSKGQISSFRPLVRPFFPHNFLTKYPYNPLVAPRFPQTPHVYSPSFVSPQRFYDVGWSCVIRSFGCPPPTAMAMGAKEQETRRSPMKRSKRLLILKEHESYESYETRRSPTDQREVMTAERKHRRCLLSHDE